MRSTHKVRLDNLDKLNYTRDVQIKTKFCYYVT